MAEQRLVIWAGVDWLLPIQLKPVREGAAEAEYLGLRYQLLPRVPVAGEDLVLPGAYTRVERVRWSADGRVTVRLNLAIVEPAYLDELRDAGWDVFPRHDADEWAARLLDGR